MSERICSVDGCDRVCAAKGLCRSHYAQRRHQAKKQAQELAPLPRFRCVDCRKEFDRVNRSGPAPQRCDSCKAEHLRRYGREKSRRLRSGAPLIRPRRAVRMDQTTCSVDYCDTAARRRGWCGRHYNRWRLTGDPTSGPQPVKCAECGEVFYPRSANALCGNCQDRPRWDRAPRPCTDCGDVFTPKPVGIPAERCDRCDHTAAMTARQRWVLRNPEANQAAREDWKRRNPERLREYVEKRRALAAELEWEAVDRQSVFERDGWVCQLCWEPVDPELQYPHPMSKTLDHVHPRRHGGGHVYTNVVLAHMACNSRKGARVDVL